MNIEMEQPILSQFFSQKRGQRLTTTKASKEVDKEYDVLVMDVIRVAVTSDAKMGAAWIQAIQNTTSPLKNLDLLLLFVLHDIPNKKKGVESLMKNKIRTGEMTEELIKKHAELNPTNKN